MSSTPARPRVVEAGDPRALREAVAAIRAGDLVAVPTETVYGIACALEQRALDRLADAKGRPEGRAIALLVDSLEQAAALAELPTAALRLIERFWPGPLTLVLPLRDGAALPAAVVGDDAGARTAGFRMPDHPLPRLLARTLGPLPLTSANRSGEPEARDARAVSAALGEHVGLILDAGAVRGGVASSVVAVRADGSLRILREGALTGPRLEEALA